MKIVVQRVSQAKVNINGKSVGEIGQGLLLLIGITRTDTLAEAEFLADKVINLRIFEDNEGKMNLSVLDIAGGILAISQFTLYADTKKGRRPSFIDAAPPDQAEPLYLQFVELLKESKLEVATGSFGAMMDVTFTNHGPVTIILEK